ncbi:MAG: hypothetical protein ACI8RD_005566, partial [Bacillariaceae sp.]
MAAMWKELNGVLIFTGMVMVSDSKSENGLEIKYL